MNVWFVVPKYDDCVWISQDEKDRDHGYASEELALRAREALDALDHEAHQQRELHRLERNAMYQEARSILEINGFADVDKVTPARTVDFEPRIFESRYNVIAMEIKE